MKILIIAVGLLFIAMFLGMYPRYKKMRTELNSMSVRIFL